MCYTKHIRKPGGSGGDIWLLSVNRQSKKRLKGEIPVNENFSEKAHVNKTALFGHTIIGVVLALAYALEYFKGSRTLGYYTVFALLCIVPVIVEHILYRKDPEDGKIKHIMGVGYGILYLFAIFTTNSLLTCMYAFPMFMVIICLL